MTEGPPGLEGGLTDYGDREFARFLRRSFAKSMGYSDESLAKPIVGICTTESGFNNCHRHFPELIEATKRGVLAQGALPIVFPVLSLGEAFLHPTSLIFRNLMAMAVEEMIRAQPMDAVVLVGGCDKTVPALLLGAISAGKPAVLLTAGPMMTGRYHGERLGACTDCRRYWAQFRAGKTTAEQLKQIEGSLAVTAGTCPVMGTASTMALIAETMGLMLPDTASIPAVHADRLRAAERTGSVAADLAKQGGPSPAEFITSATLENALRVVLAASGSTNALIHLAALAGRCGLELDLERFNELSAVTPVLVDLKPTGVGYMEDFHAAGGLDGLLRRLQDKLNCECRDITGCTLTQRLAQPPAYPIDTKIIRELTDPVAAEGGLIALFGSLAPAGAILKRAAATPSLLEHEGKAVVFTSLADLAQRIDDPDLEVEPDDILVLQNVGPRSAAGMPEAGFLPIPKKLAQAGVKDMVRISDARMSGTAFGTVVLHVTPEADLGGPLALVRSGDRIRLSAKKQRLDLLVNQEVLEERLTELPPPRPAPKRGYARLYHRCVLPATLGCDFNFLRPDPPGRRKEPKK